MALARAKAEQARQRALPGYIHSHKRRPVGAYGAQALFACPAGLDLDHLLALLALHPAPPEGSHHTPATGAQHVEIIKQLLELPG